MQRHSFAGHRPPSSFVDERDAIAEAIEQQRVQLEYRKLHQRARRQRVDASLLLMPCVGYKAADDPRIVSTYERILERLGRDGLLYRYEHGYDGLGSQEGAFGICSFLGGPSPGLPRATSTEAKRLFEHVLSFANDLGLFGEEIDPETGAALGNFPQAFTHVGLINAAIAIERRWQR